MFQPLRNLGQSIKTGFKKGVATQDQLADERFGKENRQRRYSHSVIPIFGLDGGYYQALGKRGVGLQTPAELAGAVGARFLTDVGDDATRHVYWRYNHPMAIGDKIAEQIVGDNIYNYNSAQRAAIKLGGLGVPMVATMGTMDLTNLGELGRPKGFAQGHTELGAEDRRQTNNPLMESFDRYFLGRRGRPLKYETAKEDIPDLTKQRYANYMNTLYNDRGLLGLGVLKGTMENLEGKPELLVAGFPVGLETAGALTGGASAIRAATANPQTVTTPIGVDPPKNVVPGSKKKIPGGMSYQQMPSARKVLGYGAAGAAAGIIAGKMTNALIAAGARKDLPTTQEYGVTSYQNDAGGITKVEGGKRYDQLVPPNKEFPKGLYSEGY